MPNSTTDDLLKRINELEQENSALRDKLDLIYSIVAPPDEEMIETGDEDDTSGDDLVQIQKIN